MMLKLDLTLHVLTYGNISTKNVWPSFPVSELNDVVTLTFELLMASQVILVMGTYKI